MRMDYRIAISVCCLLSGAAGCDVDDEDGDLEDLGDVEMRDCPPWKCGLNSAEVNARSIRELNLDGLYNDDDIKIVGFVAPLGILGNYQLAVEGGELVARSGNNVLRGAALLGATILVQKKPLHILDIQLPIPITVLGHSTTASWADGAPDVHRYALVYPDLSALLGSRNVCNGNLTDLLATTATVLGGETYDLVTKEVNADQNRWFTIACPNSAADKLNMLGYGPQLDFDGTGLPATPDQRQATLKMITADYCGDGTSYTVNGTPIQWSDAAGTVNVSGTPGPVEAIWNKHGAVCFGTPRVPGTQIACTLPSCAGHSLSEGEWITRVPAP